MKLRTNALKEQVASGSLGKIIRIYQHCEGRIEKSVSRITVWHCEACRVMTNDDPEGRIFLSYPQTNNGFFSCSSLILFIYLFQNKLPEVPEYAKMQFHMTKLLDVLGKIAWVRQDFLSQGKEFCTQDK